LEAVAASKKEAAGKAWAEVEEAAQAIAAVEEMKAVGTRCHCRSRDGSRNFVNPYL
jgi:hypothetical protein